MVTNNKTVAYFYDEEIGNFCYGGGNPMRPHRARMTKSLVDSYGLGKELVVHRPQPRSFEQLTEFHADEYISFLKTVTPASVDEHMNQLRRFNMGTAGEADCPVFDGLYEYCQIYSGGSVDGAARLGTGDADICLNWSGGMHHAKKAEASGFCFVNDIVMAILELLKVYGRVLYVDIDIHHGDGVEEAFYLTDRVMTVSFHKYGEFFPGTGSIDDIGYSQGKHYTVNVPLKDGMDDASYKFLYEPIMTQVMERYQPGAIVMCCGADSLSGDRLGCFNLSLEGHSHCLEFLSKFNVPMLVLGGGGYTLRNVARCWCYETGRMMGKDLPDVLPEGALHNYNFYLDTQRLRIQVSNMKNANTREELEEIKTQVLQQLSQMPPAPSAQMAYRPSLRKQEELPEEDLDVRGGGQHHQEARRGREYDDDEQLDDQEVGRRGPRDVPSADADPTSDDGYPYRSPENPDPRTDPTRPWFNPQAKDEEAGQATSTHLSVLEVQQQQTMAVELVRRQQQQLQPPQPPPHMLQQQLGGMGHDAMPHGNPPLDPYSYLQRHQQQHLQQQLLRELQQQQQQLQGQGHQQGLPPHHSQHSGQQQQLGQQVQHGQQHLGGLGAQLPGGLQSAGGSGSAQHAQDRDGRSQVYQNGQANGSGPNDSRPQGPQAMDADSAEEQDLGGQPNGVVGTHADAGPSVRPLQDDLPVPADAEGSAMPVVVDRFHHAAPPVQPPP